MFLFKMLFSEIIHHWNNFLLTLIAIVAAATLFVAGPSLINGYTNDTQQRIIAHNQQTVDQLKQMEKDAEIERSQLKDEAKKEMKHLSDRTKRKMRDLGYNLRIVHQDTDLAKLHSDFIAVDMPEEYIYELAKSPAITKVVHLVARLYQMIDYKDGKALIVGLAPEVTQSHLEKKSDMQRYQVKSGMVVVGHAIGANLKIGETIEILGSKFKVQAIQPQQGTREDIVLALNLPDAQKLLNKKGKITEIRALGCKCKSRERLEEIIPQLEKALKDVKVFELTTQAMTRDEQRKLVKEVTNGLLATHEKSREKMVAYQNKSRQEMLLGMKKHRDTTQSTMTILTNAITPLVLLVCTAWIGLLAWANVRQRRSEIGLLRALGKGAGSIASLFLGKALILGFIGGTLGCLIGFFLARNIATGALDVASANFTVSWQILTLGIIGSPMVCVIASYLPTLIAIRQDPAIVLSDD